MEGEESGMFGDHRLPTLDTAIWVDEESENISHSFYEKPTCPNVLIQKTTALSESSIRATLVQEVVRRLKNCSECLSVEEKQGILSVFCQKAVNSGHSVRSVQYILVHGLTRYNDLVENSKRRHTDPLFKPLHCDKRFDCHGRKLGKLLAKTGWYNESDVKVSRMYKSYNFRAHSGHKN